MKYRYLSHAADAKFRAYGATLEEAFANAALATAGLIWDRRRSTPEKKYSVSLSGLDLPQLLVLFLEEILFLLETKDFLLRDVEQLKIVEQQNRYFLAAVLLGIKLTPEIQILGQVKAVTYNDMQVDIGTRVKLQVVVDM